MHRPQIKWVNKQTNSKKRNSKSIKPRLKGRHQEVADQEWESHLCCDSHYKDNDNATKKKKITPIDVDRSIAPHTKHSWICTQNANWFIHFALPLQNTYNLCMRLFLFDSVCVSLSHAVMPSHFHELLFQIPNENCNKKSPWCFWCASLWSDFIHLADLLRQEPKKKNYIAIYYNHKSKSVLVALLFNARRSMYLSSIYWCYWRQSSKVDGFLSFCLICHFTI